MTKELPISENRPGLVLRYGVLAGVLWATALVMYGILRYPSAFMLSPVEAIIYLALFVGLIGGYIGVALRMTRVVSATSKITMRWGIWLGLGVGLCWLIELWAGNLADPSTNVVVLAAYRGSIWAVLVVTMVATWTVSRQTHLRQNGVWVGLWSGIISALMTFSGLMIIAYSGALVHDPQTIQQSMKQGVTDVMVFSVADSLVAAINHLWIGPLLGILLGMVSGFIGTAGRQNQYTTG